MNGRFGESRWADWYRKQTARLMELRFPRAQIDHFERTNFRLVELVLEEFAFIYAGLDTVSEEA